MAHVAANAGVIRWNSFVVELIIGDKSDQIGSEIQILFNRIKHAGLTRHTLLLFRPRQHIHSAR